MIFQMINATATILLIIILIYIVLGMFLKSLAMLVFTTPVVIPVAAALEWDLIWFGIIVLIALEKGLILPPVGVNIFIVKSLVSRLRLRPRSPG